MRRGTPHIPAPFQRPSVSLSGPQDRAWQDIAPAEVLPGDTVVDYGLVVSVTKGADFFRLKFKSGHEIDSRYVDQVRAFHPVG